MGQKHVAAFQSHTPWELQTVKLYFKTRFWQLRINKQQISVRKVTKHTHTEAGYNSYLYLMCNINTRLEVDCHSLRTISKNEISKYLFRALSV